MWIGAKPLEHTLALWVALALLGQVVRGRSKTCNRERQVHTEPRGFITDGEGNYHNNSHCEWLIQAPPGKQAFITLNITQLNTECAFDHLYIYDGDSYSAPMLASLSGLNRNPPHFVSRSGSMLILLYSDTNYVLEGFTANYSIHDCPLNCSERGKCVDHVCRCSSGFTGEACEFERCPKNCSSSAGHVHGKCTEAGCVCLPGFSGTSCSLPSVSEKQHVGWHLLADSQNSVFSPRAGHSVAYVTFTDRLYTFGGKSFSTVFGDFLVYDFASSKWTSLRSKLMPAARWGHAMVHHADSIVLFGGELANGTLSNELWIYNVQKQEWSLEEPDASGVDAPMVALHSLTMTEPKTFIVFGGRMEGGQFSNKIYKISLTSGKPKWERIELSAGNPVRVVGHSATFHAASRSILVYGGIVADMARFSKLSASLYAFNVEKRHWTQLHYQSSGRSQPTSSRSQQLQKPDHPYERAFHTATIAGNYLVIFGGYMHRHSLEEKCFDDQVYLYHLKCYKWVSYDILMSSGDGVPKSQRAPPSAGVYSHGMALRRGGTLLILGGYSGQMRGDLRALQLPETITHITSETASVLCGDYNNSEVACRENPACGWCSLLSICMDRNKKADCGGHFSVGSCPTLCLALRDCQSCMAWGEGQEITNHVMVDAGGFMPRSCGWCVSSSECHSLNDPPQKTTLCGTSENKTIESEGYWGNHGYVVTNLPECRSHNYKPGLTFVQYSNPVNYSLPDDLTMINSSAARIVFPANKGDKSGGIAQILGYLHPTAVALDASSGTPKIFIRSGFNSELKMSLDDKEANLELVAVHNNSNFNMTEAVRPSGNKLIPIVGKGARYLLNMTIQLQCDRNPVRGNCENYSEIKWCQQLRSCLHSSLIPIKYLEPYKNGSDCYRRVSCLACLVDSACGWCHSKGVCVSRLSDDDGQCPATKDGELLVLEPEQCSNCNYHIYCDTCLSDPNCEWMAEDVTCKRRGKSPSALLDRSKCPTPCHLRQGCDNCLNETGRCAWCQQTQQCFLFSTYISSFMYGGCREWADKDIPALIKRGNVKSGPMQCPDCTRHSDCKSCLSQLGCGWCGNVDNPNIGNCSAGDFSGPYSGNCTEIVSSASSNDMNEVIDQTASWSYAKCPNVDECRLQLAKCHHNATCHDTEDSYICVCNKGFKGDGKSECVKTCDEDCNHGTCSEAPEYKCICEIGWTGDFCDKDCGCNFHSRCSQGIGRCDECRHHTAGPRCNRCVKGAFGDATRLQGCSLCKCNGHGDPDKNFCDPVTGNCYCIHNTKSKSCQRCLPGFYGDPRDNGTCFKDCTDHKPFLTEPFGALGSREGSSLAPQHCLWIVHGHKHSTIQLTLATSLNIKCPENYVYVYEGLYSANSPGQLLASFCGTQLNAPIVVSSKTNQLSVYYRRSKLHEGFNATYKQMWCPEGCTGRNRVCQDGLCVCKPGFSGPLCDVKLCPKACSSQTKSGTCEQAYSLCRCSLNYGGDACDVDLNSHQSVVWTLLYDVERVFSADTLTLADLVVDSPPDIQFGHSLLVSEPDSHIWLFGGVSQMDQDSNRLYIYDKDFYQWKKVNVSHDESKMPSPRRHHCATIVGKDMYVYGGMNSQFSAVGDFWKFATVHRTWTTIATGPDVPPLVGCTLTNVHNTFLLMIGGYSPENGFQEKTLIYTIQDTTFKVFNTTGASPEGIYGHTAEYHAPTDSIYVFGGILYEAAGSLPSSTLFALHVGSRIWTRLPADDRVSPNAHIAPRFFHSSALVGDMMYIIGGRDAGGETTLDTHIYNIKCNSWVELEGFYVKVNGTPPAHFSSASAVNLNGEVYIYGGSTYQPQGSFYKISLPSDLCNLFYRERLGCLTNPGCSFCSVVNSTGGPPGRTEQFCFKIGQGPRFCDPLAQGARNCSTGWIQNRTCELYETCVDCLAQWPSEKGVLQPSVCQWCPDCQKGRCLPIGSSCPVQTTPDCNDAQEARIVYVADQCPQRSCVASECEKCRDQGKCMWTRQVLRSGELKHIVSQTPTFDWTCVRKTVKDQVNHPVESNPPRSCPRRCGSYTNCTTCLESTGGEGSAHQCWWASSLGQCITPTFAPIRCEGGMCGPLLQGDAHICSPPCHYHSQSKLCLSDPRCGWCALLGANGQGLCMEGSREGPTGGSCQNGTVFLNGHPLPGEVPKWLQTHGSNVGWYYFKRPMEDECQNGHHDCDPEKEKCVDRDDGYECVCQEGYTTGNNNTCRPVCRQGCEHGECVRPDECKCGFGYVGSNCTIACQCNGHSNCQDIDNLDVCLSCHNNTQGPQCSQCVTGYVGDPTDGGKCVSCYHFCHKHSTQCIDEELMASLDDVTKADYEELMKIAQSKPGPLQTAVCLNCTNNTTGKTCDFCKDGFFIRDGDIVNGCRPCECHGHGDTCDKLTGESCICRNNTETDRSCNPNSRTKHASCWSLQCAKCKDNFQGIPINGHQCYRHMRLEQEYCFDPGNQGECNSDQALTPLVPGKPVFFVVQPRYMNVNIRIMIDIAYGQVDVHLGPKEDIFVVSQHKNGSHVISIDPKYEAVVDDSHHPRTPLETKNHSKESATATSTVSRRRETSPVNSVANREVFAKYPNAQADITGNSKTMLQLVKREGSGLITYVEIKKPHHLIVVRKLTNRLILTIPQSVYDLRSTRLYLIIHGEFNGSSGSIFFRQDQTRIDLFVFFSVFFSCFFLFLSMCVVLWKIKQSLDTRRLRRLQAAEMQHMANRPFSKIYSTMYSIEEDPDDWGFVELSPLTSKSKRKSKSQVHLANTPRVTRAFEHHSPGGTCRPVSVEPTADGQAAVTTMLISLPGGSSAPLHLCIGSALTSIRGTMSTRC